MSIFLTTPKESKIVSTARVARNYEKLLRYGRVCVQKIHMILHVYMHMYVYAYHVPCTCHVHTIHTYICTFEGGTHILDLHTVLCTDHILTLITTTHSSNLLFFILSLTFLLHSFLLDCSNSFAFTTSE